LRLRAAFAHRDNAGERGAAGGGFRGHSSCSWPGERARPVSPLVFVLLGPVSWGCALGAILRGSGAILRGSGAILRGSGAIIRRLLMIARCSESLLLSLHRFGSIVPHLGARVPHVGRLSTLIGRDVSRDRGSPTGLSVLLSEMRRMLTMHTGRVASPLIRPGDGFHLAGELILLRSGLVAV
jgi:hypothetical protein